MVSPQGRPVLAAMYSAAALLDLVGGRVGVDQVRFQPRLEAFYVQEVPRVEVKCTVALSDYRRTKAWEMATHLLAEMKTCRCTPDAFTYGAGVSCMAKAAQWPAALAILNESQQAKQWL